MDELDNILKEFLVESYENLDQLDRDLVALESDPGNLDTLASIFRTIHTIKGTCGFLGLSKLEAVSHAGESLLGFLREGAISLDSKRTTVLLTMVDAIREILGKIEATDAEGDKDYSKLIQSIVEAQEQDAAETRRADKRQEATLGSSVVNALFPAAASPNKSFVHLKSSGPTLLTRIGGLEKVSVVTKRFYRLVCQDAKLKRFFAKVKMGPFQNNQTACLVLALGGDEQAGTAAFWGAHNKLGMTENLSPRVCKHLAAALKSQSVKASLRKEILAALDPVAPERKKPAATPDTSAPAAAGQTPKLEEGIPMSYLSASEENSTGETEQTAAPGSSPAGSSIADSSIRVDVNLLDNLMNLVGELVLARNQILQHSTENASDTGFNVTAQRLNLITTELQAGVMKTRMQPIGNIWSKFPRVVRDLALAGQKKIRVEMEGKDTELDKTIIEAIKDPLTHLVRNSADHGIERPESRLAAGKPAEGRLQLRAFHEGGQVNIEITDDGGGIDPEAIKQQALKQGLVTPDQVIHMSEREALSLIFLPGFTTATKVTNLSGRGVGMDVVKTNIEKIGGTVDVYSTLGQGTTVKMKIPLTLAIIPALVVTCGGDRYAIPQISLLELVRLDGDDSKRGIEMIHGAPVYRLRGHLLPLVDLSQELGVTGKASRPEAKPGEDAVNEGAVNVVVRLKGEEARKGIEMAQGAPVDEVRGELLPAVNLSREPGAEGEVAGSGSETGQSEDGVNIVVLQAEERQFGLIVEGIQDTEEIVVKPLGMQLKNISIYSGTTIMGDGTVALILDVLGLAQRAAIIGEDSEKAIAEKAVTAPEEQEAARNRQTLLVFEVGQKQRVGMPLSMVARLEEFPSDAVEHSADRDVVQYRGEIMPLIYLAPALGFAENGTAEKETLQVVVYTEKGQSVGLVVSRILDIIEQVIAIEREDKTIAGLLGSVVIQDKVTNLLDVRGVITKTDPTFFDRAATAAVEV